MKDIVYIAAFPKSGITYLNYMLFHALFDAPQSTALIDSHFIFDLHEHLGRVPPPSRRPTYVKIHAPFSPRMPLYDRAVRAVYLVRDPIDVMMSAWDFKHLLGERGLLEASAKAHEARFRAFRQGWLASGGLAYPWAGSWVENVGSWLDQKAMPTLVLRYEELKANPSDQLERVLAFLERPVSRDRIGAAVEAGRPENMRRQEERELASGASGAFYRPSLAKGYAHGYRFVGRLHEGAYQKRLSTPERSRADAIFGSMMARVRERSA